MSRTILLTQGSETIVDDDDYGWLLKMGKWYAQQNSKKKYAICRGKIEEKWSTIYMHRVIIDAPKSLEVDHINGDSLDNRKVNLRICTRSQNKMNRAPIHSGSSKFKGVDWRKNKSKWRARIQIRGCQIALGHFCGEVDAAKAYDMAAKKIHGEFAWLNFPEKRDSL